MVARPQPIRRFNEAAAHHRGEQTLTIVNLYAVRCFNEAAAHHRGELIEKVTKEADRAASMRPRLITAENPVGKGVGNVAGMLQ